MDPKIISLPEDVYRKLAAEKRQGESFGDVVDRLLRARTRIDVTGGWSEATARRALDATRDGRERADRKLKKWDD